MKKITLLLLLLLASISGYSQFTPTVEGFESTTGPDALPSTNWTLSTGNWAVFDNGVGLAQRWGINATLPYQGTNAAYCNRENIGAGNTSEDYLASPLITVPSNGQLHFWTRSFSSGNQGTIYRVMVAPAVGVQTSPASYSLVQEWTEATLTTTFNVYEEKTVSLSAYANQQVYIAFVMVWSQPGTALGDRWLVDNVSLVEQCTDPTALTVLSTTSTTATLTWGNPSGATSWSIEVVPSTGTPTGVGTTYNGTLPYVATGLLPNTSYTFYVKAICTNSSSLWVGPSSTFTTQVAPPQCGGNYLDSGAAAGNYSNNESITTTICPATSGDVVTVTFTAFNTEAGNDILQVYNGSSNLGTLLGTFSGTTIPPSFTSSATDGCLTFVFTSNATNTSTGWASNITCGPPPPCPQPIALSATTVLSTTATLGWTNAGSATSWQVLALPCTSPAPNASTTGWTATTSNPYTITGLTPDTCYNLYVRSDCSASSNGVSLWAGPVQVTTQIAPPVCGGTFVDTGGSAGNYPNNANTTTTICPSTPGDVVSVTFTSFNTEAVDLLNVYNGDNTFGTLIGTYSGNTLPPVITSTAANGCLTFVFTSNGTTNAAGWVANVTCAPPPACQQPIGLTTSTLLSTSVSLGWTSAGSATTWQVLALPCADPAPTASSTGWTSTTSNPFTITGLTPNTCYNLYVRSDCSNASNGVSEWSAPATITTPVAPPVCGGNYVDSGGTANAYSNSEDITTTICPTNPGDVVTVTFVSFNTEANWDGIYVFNGNSIGAPPILSTNPIGNGPMTTPGAFWGTVAPEPFTSTSPDGCLTFHFLSDASVTRDGFIANITCAPPTGCARPTAIVSSAITNTSVTLSWTQPPSADTTVPTAWQVIALPCGSPTPDATTTGYVDAATNPFTLTGLTAVTCYDIYVRAACSATDNSVWLGPKKITTDVNPPTCGGVYTDSAGPNANYADNSNSTVTICPDTPGDVVTVTFTSFATEAGNDLLRVYNGTDNTATLIGTFSGTNIPPAITSSAASGCLTFVFTSNGFTNNTGWTADVTCGPPPPCQQPLALTASTILSDSVTLGWTNAGSATAWQVLALPCTDPAPTDTTTGWVAATTNPFVITGLTQLTCYNLYVRSDCNAASGGVSTWSLPISITTQIAPPECGGFFYDPQGPTTNYLNSTDSTVTICPNNTTDVVTVTFTSFNTETNWDGLLVYDGNSISAPQLASANGIGFGPIAAYTGAYWGNLTGANLPGPFTSSSVDGCLTFRFISDPSVNNPGWVANVTCSPAPACPKPSALTATLITPTSALLGWTEQNPNVTSWQVLVLPFGSAAPLPDATGWTQVGINPVVWTGLTPGTQYTFYVRSNCPDSVGGGNSIWSSGHNFSTLIINDECSGAVFAPVNSSAECGQITAGTITGATASSVPLDAPCIGTADDDVWFQYIATNSYLNIALQSILPAGTNLDFAVYSGSCGTLTQIFCSGVTGVGTSGTVNGMTVGETYYIRVYSNGTTPVAANFNLCISTPSTCPTASTVCSLTDYVNTTGVTSLGTIGCLFTSPNPAYFTIQVATTGPINYTLTQSTQPSVGGIPGPANIDVDYAAWGPFNSQDEACTFIGAAQPFAAPGIGVPVTQQTGCSYSAAPTESLNIANAVAGQFYIILITNFSNQPGYITLTQNNVTTDPNHGETNCCPNASFSYNPVTYCKEPGATNPVAQINNGSVAGTFTSSPAGLVFANDATGEVDLAASAPGLYIVTNTVSSSATCTERTSTSTIQIVLPVSASFTYEFPSYCNVLYTTPILPFTFTGATGGTFAANPNGGLYLDVASGAITPSLSSPGIYTVTYVLPGTGACVGSNPTAIVEIIGAPTPSFAQVVPICPGDPLANLPTTSIDGFTGTWSPAMDNTTTTTYTFTPDAGLCATTATMTIEVGSTIPLFTQVPPICPGATLAALPTTSNNGVNGTWSPALDNTQTTTYTFTPSSGNCVANATMTIQVLPLTVVPTFTPVAPICPNGALTALPITSNNSITGSWSPALDNTQTTTYTFTPDTAQCALPTTLNIIVNPELLVTVNNPTFCPGSLATVTATPAIPGNYTYVWTVPTGATDPGNVASFDTNIAGTYSVVISQVNTFCNSDFETPVATGTTPNLIADNLVPCWNTTATDAVIEFWPPGFEGVAPYSGNNLVELNANTPGTLYQDFSVIPGTSISVSFAHRGRQGTDVVGVEVGPVGGPYVSLGNYSDGNTAWGYHTVNYTVPNTGGNNYTLRFVSVSSAGGSPSIGNLLDTITISSLSCPSQPASGTVSIQTLPAPTVTVTDPTCTVQTGTIEVTSPLNTSGGGLPANLFISEVTDASTFNLTYVELYNGTGSPVDLSNYKLKFYTWGNPPTTENASCDLQLSGIIANNSTNVIKVSGDANITGIVPDQTFVSCSGVNYNDNIRLTDSSDVLVDLWGTTDGSTYTPAGQAGYTYRRLNTATVPSVTWNPADWTSIDDVATVVDYTNVGTYSYFTSTYEYSLDSGTYQSGTTFTGVAPGSHTITVHDLITGCYSLPFNVTVGPIVGQITTTFNPITICNGDAVTLPATSLEGVTGTWNPSTVDNTLTATYAFTPDAGQCASTANLTITVNQKVTPTFNAVAAICNGDALNALPTTSLNGYTGTWSPALDNTTTTTYTFTPDVNQCATTTTLTITVNPKVTPTFNGVATICSGDALSALPTTSLNGYTGTWSPALNNTVTTTYTFTPGANQCANTATLTITVTPKVTPTFQPIASLCNGDTNVPSLPSTSIEGITGTWSPSTISTTATATYSFTPDAGQCANNGSLTVNILDSVAISAVGDCQNNAFVLTVSPTSGTFDPSVTFSWENDSSVVVGNAQTLTVSTAGTYTVTVTFNGCVSTDQVVVSAEDIACTIQKGISVNGDGLNDVFDLSGFNVKKITIFNRYGMEVYSKTDYTNQWKGESNSGDELPDGTYYYVFNRANGETRTGWIYINREN